MRPIAEPANHLVIASAADSKPQDVWAIDDSSMIVQKEGVLLKSKYFNSIETIMGDSSQFSKAFAGGTLTHSFLDVNDYHRYHFPVGGTIKESRLIPGADAAGGITIWDEASKRYILQCDTPGWQMIETRGAVVVDNPELGLVAMLPIGMSQVSSVNFEKNLKVGGVVNNGDMLGYFLFGGSDFVILFQKGVEFTPAVEPKTHLLMGEKLGTVTLNKNKKSSYKIL